MIHCARPEGDGGSVSPGKIVSPGVDEFVEIFCLNCEVRVDGIFDADAAASDMRK